MKPTLLAAVSLFISGVGSIGGEKEAHPKLPDTALELIDELKGTQNIYTTWESRLNYVKEADLPYLFELIDSEERCAHSVMSVSSHWPKGQSSVGDEAAYLIESFLMRLYPSKLSSDQDKLNKTVLKHWYRNWSRLKKETEQDAAGNPLPNRVNLSR